MILFVNAYLRFESLRPSLSFFCASPVLLTVLLVLQGQHPEPRGEPGRAALQHGVPALRCQRRSAEGAAAGGDGTNGRARWTKSREDVPEPLQNHTVSQCGMWRHQQCVWGMFLTLR